MVRQITNRLKDLGYIHQSIGRTFYEDKSRGTQTRMWATQKLLWLFSYHQIAEPDFISKPEPELIQMTNQVKIKKS
jgi:hypothetical protein